MHKFGLSWLLCLSCAAALAAQEEALPSPKALPPPPKVTPLPPPPVDGERDLDDLQRWLARLKKERESLAAEQHSAKQQMATDVFTESADTVKLRLHLSELIKKATTPKIVGKSGDPSGPVVLPKTNTDKKVDAPVPKSVPEMAPPKEITKEGPEPTAPPDPVALAHVLFRAGHFDQALKAYRMMPLTGLRAEERGPIQYLTACCLRKIGKTEEALALYRDVANLRGDEQMAACAQWQIAQIRWRSEMETQLKNIRARRQALEPQP